MSDLIKRLRQGVKAASFNDWDFDRTEADMDEAADEITRLEARVKQLEGDLNIMRLQRDAKRFTDGKPDAAARAALNPSKEPA